MLRPFSSSQVTPGVSPNPTQLTLSRSDSLLRILEDIHNHIYANDGLSPEQALDETIRILFIKICDEKSRESQFTISPAEYSNVTNGKNDLGFLNRVEELQQRTYSHYASIFEKGDKVGLRPATLAYVVNKLQGIDLLTSSHDVKGLAFQKFINSSQRIGRGQFFTPEQVIRLCVDFIEPQPHELILDPACGSAGFLSYALKYVSLNSAKSSVHNRLYGVEINTLAARIAKMRMILADDGLECIIHHDSLADWSDLNLAINRAVNGDAKTYQNYFDVILTNPPFGTRGKISNKSILRNYELGHKWIQTANGWLRTTEIMNGQVPEILFIERALDFLKPGGRMAIVLPNGELENSSLTYLRFFIQEKAHVIAVVKLPQDTFIPSGTGVKTSVLFLMKKDAGKFIPRKVFFADVTNLGYLGNKNASPVYKRDSEGNVLKDLHGDPIVDEDSSEAVRAYALCKAGKSLLENDTCFTIDRQDLGLSRFDLESYRPRYRRLLDQLKRSNAIRLGELVEMKGSKSPKLAHQEAIVNYIELSDISIQYNEIINSTECRVYELPSRASYEVKAGDLITAVAGNSIGTRKHASAIVTRDFDGAICTNGFRVLVPDLSKVNPHYLLHYFNSSYFLDQVYRSRTGAAIPALSDEDLLDILILLPEPEEQARIGKLIFEGFKQRELYRNRLKMLKIGT